MNDKTTAIYAAVIIGLFVVLPLIYYNRGYWAGVEDTSEEPRSLMVTVSILSLNVTTYNMSWYDVGFGDPEQQPVPELYNDSFVIYIYARWGESGLYMGNEGLMPHVNITAIVLPLEYDMNNFTVERVGFYRYDLIEWQTINFYDNELIRTESIDYIGVVLFGHGSLHSDIKFWSMRNVLFAVGSVWYEEREEILSVVLPDP